MVTIVQWYHLVFSVSVSFCKTAIVQRCDRDACFNILWISEGYIYWKVTWFYRWIGCFQCSQFFSLILNKGWFIHDWCNKKRATVNMRGGYIPIVRDHHFVVLFLLSTRKVTSHFLPPFQKFIRSTWFKKITI